MTRTSVGALCNACATLLCAAIARLFVECGDGTASACAMADRTIVSLNMVKARARGAGLDESRHGCWRYAAGDARTLAPHDPRGLRDHSVGLWRPRIDGRHRRTRSRRGRERGGSWRGREHGRERNSVEPRLPQRRAGAGDPLHGGAGRRLRIRQRLLDPGMRRLPRHMLQWPVGQRASYRRPVPAPVERGCVRVVPESIHPRLLVDEVHELGPNLRLSRGHVRVRRRRSRPEVGLLAPGGLPCSPAAPRRSLRPRRARWGLHVPDVPGLRGLRPRLLVRRVGRLLGRRTPIARSLACSY
jgi:hypothetical protein